jgi:two-component system sensor histidine kinase YesM
MKETKNLDRAHFFVIIKNSYYKLSLFKRMFIGITFVVSLIVAFSSIINYKLSLDSYISATSKNTEYLVNTINEYIEDDIERVNSITSLFYVEKDRRDAIVNNSDKKPAIVYKNLLTISTFFEQLLYFKEINNFYLYVMDGRDYSYTRVGRGIPNYNPIPEDWFQKTLLMDGGLIVLPPHKPYQLTEGEDVFSYSRALKDIDSDNKKILAVLLIDIPVKYMERKIDNIDLSKDTHIIIFDNNINFIYGGESIKTVISQEQIASNISSSSKGQFKIRLEKDTYLATYEVSTSTGWKILLLTPYSQLTKNAKNMQLLFLITGIFTLIMSSTFALIFSKLVYRTLKKLKKGFAEVKKGNFKYFIEIEHNDEITEILYDFNNAIKRISDLIMFNYEERTARTEAEYKYLQAQMKPHFIFNSLQMIISIAQMKKDKEITEITKSLAGVIKYCINIDKKVVRLKDEIENAIDYMDLSRIRYDDYITFITDIDDDISEFTIIKLVLQPLIENSIVHGVEPKGEKGFIKLSIKIINQDIKISLLDNGIGLSNERVHEIWNNINQIETYDFEDNNKHNNVGLKNINMRLKAVYGENAGLHIESKLNLWTKISFTIPAKSDSEV